MPDKDDALRRMFEEVLAPLIEADGGELYLVAIGKKEVRIHLGGSWSGSPACAITTQRIVEPAVHAVSPKIKVLVTNGFRIPEGAQRISPSSS
ncbi:MAG TPA: NifU family protein [Polyangiaceae bacterium]|jgi:Fe-S cluster biogenesis protein NfuA|nr:NifU family protein [Polyangiaceae bacterium]